MARTTRTIFDPLATTLKSTPPVVRFLVLVAVLQTVAIGVLFAMQLRDRGSDSNVGQRSGSNTNQRAEIPIYRTDPPNFYATREAERMRSDLENLKADATRAAWDRMFNR